jgi:hypothetical protein
MLVDVGRTTRREAVLIPPHALARLQVRFPRLARGCTGPSRARPGPGHHEAMQLSTGVYPQP